MNSNYIKCATCARSEIIDVAGDEGWLMRQRVGKAQGWLIIRCPEHITDYSLRQAGISREQFYRGGGPAENGN